MSAGTPFEIDWALKAQLQDAGAGRMDLEEFEASIHGLKGGTQKLSGKGTYDPKKSTGNLTARAEKLSLPLLNPYLEPSAKMRVLSGKADMTLDTSRDGAKSPFKVKGRVRVFKPALKDLSKRGNLLKFESVGLDLVADYSPESDRLDLPSLSLNIDDIPLRMSGVVKHVQDEKKRDINLKVQGKKVEIGNLIADFAPSIEETGKISGKVDVDLTISGRTSSKKFPVLVGNLRTDVLRMIPRQSPDTPVKLRGTVLFDSDTVSADSLDVKLADVPGKVSLKVKGYNEPIKKIDAKLRGISIEPLIKIYKPAARGILIGKFNGDIKTILGQRDRPESLDIVFTIDDGTLLTRHPIPKTIVQIVQWDWLRNGIKLTNAKGKIYEDKKGYVLDSLFLMGDKGGITARGRVGFNDKIAIESRLNVAKASADELPGFIQKALRAKKGSAWAYLAFDIGGTLDKPKVRPRFSTVIEGVAGRLKDKLRDKYGDKIREKTGVDADKLIEGAGGALRGFFKKRPE